MAHPRLARRLLPAVLISILTGSVLVGVVGAGNAATGSPEQPTEVKVPHAMLGDAGSYTLDIHGPWRAGPFTDHPASFVNFTLAAGDAVRTGDGFVHATDKAWFAGTRYDDSVFLDVSFGSSGQQSDKDPWVPFHGAVRYEAGTSAVLAVESNRSGTATGEGGFLGTGVYGSGPLPHSQLVTHEKELDRLFAGDGPGCITVNPAQGRTLHVGDTFALESECHVGNIINLPSGDYEAKAIETVAGRPALRFDAATPVIPSTINIVASNPASFEFYNVSVWFASGLAAPLQVQALPWVDNGNHLTMTLTAFSAGKTARRAGPAPSSPLVPLLEAPRQPWGPDEGGLPFDLAPSEAWAHAMVDPRLQGLHDFMKAHPGAETNSAWYFQFQGAAWWFHVADGKQQYSFIVYIMQKTGLPPPLPQHVLSVIDMGETVTYLPTAKQLPASLPTWASLAKRWAQYASPADARQPANAFLYDLFGITGNGTTVLATSVFTRAGWTDTSSSPQRLDMTTTPPTVVQDRVVAASALTMLNGIPVLFSESQQNSTSRSGIAGNGAAAPASIQPAGIGAGPLPTWLPSPTQAAGISVIGVLAGFLYWLWPVAKGGTIGLFSRLRSPELLENPQRAKLLAVVEAEPGIHFQELGRRCALPNGTLVHHLAKLTKGGLLVARQSGGYTCYFPRSTGRLQMAAAPAMKSDGARAILAAVQTQPGLTSQEVAQRCGLQASTVTYHVKRLIDGALVTTVRDGRFVRLYPSALAATMVPASAAAAS